jgi:diguanylate cyclase (GGDEF)-like protein
MGPDGEMRPFAWAAVAGGGVGAVPLDDSAVAVVEWAAAEGRVVQDDRDGVQSLIVPVPAHVGDGGRPGALVCEAVGVPREEAESVGRTGARTVAGVSVLLEKTRSSRKQASDLFRILELVRDVSLHRDPSRLAERLLLEITNSTGVLHGAVVRWAVDENVGRVVAVTDGHGLKVGQRVAPDSVVGEVCRTGEPAVWNAAPREAAKSAIIGGDETPRRIESLLVYPMRVQNRLFGAFVVEDETPGAFREDERTFLTWVAEIAAPRFEALWDLEAVERRTRTDPLTGVGNRRHFELQLSEALGRAARSKAPVSVVLADVDHFKQVNDLHGHDVGDEVLKVVATVLGSNIRTVDRVSRIGGEEFALLLEDTRGSGARELTERLRAAVQAASVPIGAGAPLRVTASFGVATFPETVADAGQLYRAADEALYAAKRSGRNRVCVAGDRVITPTRTL